MIIVIIVVVVIIVYLIGCLQSAGVPLGLPSVQGRPFTCLRPLRGGCAGSHQ